MSKKINVEISDMLEDMIEEYTEEKGYNKSQALREMIAKGYVFGHVKPEFVETQDRLKEVKEELKEAKKNNSPQQHIQNLQDEKDQLENRLVDLTAKMYGQFHEQLEAPANLECPVCNKKSFDKLGVLAQHISKKKDEPHDIWKQSKDVSSASEIKDVLQENIEIGEVITGKRPAESLFD